MEFKYDPQADAIYIYLSEKPYAYGRDLDDERRIDYASDNTPIGVELLCSSKGVNIDELPCKDEIVDVLDSNGVKVYTTQGYSGTMQGYSGLVFDINLASPETGTTKRSTARFKEREEVTA